MNFWEKITGRDINRELKSLKNRAKKLPADYHAAWESINTNLWSRSDFTGRNIMPILDGVLELLETAVTDGLRVREVLGDDIRAFCSALAEEEGAKSYRDRWREQLNSTIARKLNKRSKP